MATNRKVTKSGLNDELADKLSFFECEPGSAVDDFASCGGSTANIYRHRHNEPILR